MQEFARVEGIGERTAIALARTAALPGAPLRSLGALQAVARADGGAALLLFLTESPEIPEARPTGGRPSFACAFASLSPR